MRTLPVLGFILLLSGCNTLETTPQMPPAPAKQAQEVSRAQTTDLPKLGTITVTERGSPDDAQRAIAAKANAMGATYYLIIMVSETVMPGMWYATATLYGPSTTRSAQQ